MNAADMRDRSEGQSALHAIRPGLLQRLLRIPQEAGTLSALDRHRFLGRQRRHDGVHAPIRGEALIFPFPCRY